MLKIAMIGIGNINGAHRTAWKQIPEAQITAICDIRPERMPAVQQEFGCNAYTDFEDMLAHEEFDILDICLPTYLHADYAIRGLKTGHHVLCEKPISLKKEDVERVYSVVKETGKCFMIAQCVRFWREYVILKDAIDTGRYGKLMSGHMERLNSTPRTSWDNWMKDKARSGLVPFDLHIHDLDFMIYALGMPKGIRCSRGRDDTQDYIHMLYDYDGFFISAESSWFNCRFPFSSSFRFQFEHAVFEYKNGAMTIYRQDDTPIQVDETTGADVLGLEAPGKNAYVNEVRYFVDCVLAGKPCDLVKPEELIHVLETIEIIDQEA